MTKKEKLNYWTMAHTFITRHGFRIIHLSKMQDELWLEGQNKRIIRMLYLEPDIDDKKSYETLQADLEELAQRSEKIRKSLKLRNIHVENYYFVENAGTELEQVKNQFPSISTKRYTIHSEIATDSAASKIDGPANHFQMEESKDDFSIAAQTEEIKRHALSHDKSEKENEKQVFNAASPFFTYFFIALHVIMFYLLETNGGSTNTQVLIDYGAKYNPLINEGEWWRFFTPIVLHIGFLHLFMNTLALFYLGPLIERIYGRIRFLLIYLLAGFTGSLMSFVFSFTISAGASGAIFGCFGALLYFGAKRPGLFIRTMGMNVLVVIGINIVFGFTVPGIDNAAHLGGLAGGFLAAGLVSLPKTKMSFKQGIFGAALILWIVLSLQAGYSGALVQKDPMAVNAIAQEDIQDGDFSEAYAILTELKEEGEATSETYFLLAFVELNQEEYDKGIENLELAIERREGFHEAHYNLALVQLEMGNTDEAKEQAELALSYSPDHEPYRELVDAINKNRQE
ncbi:rhomboid family intramembrane serine protease [Jeotgalibacillus proteolyticus]|uniref:Rhomboid family intramembrane serine protease n=1 Tax=Jeotgalibacillus proteolyticus TaxID=2082395 RepID=A0A2S5GEW0_9BACL|nr:rhomboid family intramembrane serine protease [Jeotgalibacillus proteolyticus]PPA71413.1 rhomboid family intramembrane serine protease [Jeotgalibacillus proteolyticus]